MVKCSGSGAGSGIANSLDILGKNILRTVARTDASGGTQIPTRPVSFLTEMFASLRIPSLQHRYVMEHVYFAKCSYYLSPFLQSALPALLLQ